MKKLDLNAYGVSEMGTIELQATEGGCWVCDVIDAVYDTVKKIIHLFD